jgi:hypothetical protein
MPADLVEQAGGTMRSDLADGAEVLHVVSGAVSSAGSLPIKHGHLGW